MVRDYETTKLPHGKPSCIKNVALPFDVVGVSQIVSLTLFLDVVEHGDGGHEIHHFAGGQQVQVGTTVFPSVPVTVTRFGITEYPLLSDSFSREIFNKRGWFFVF